MHRFDDDSFPHLNDDSPDLITHRFEDAVALRIRAVAPLRFSRCFRMISHPRRPAIRHQAHFFSWCLNPYGVALLAWWPSTLAKFLLAARIASG